MLATVVNNGTLSDGMYEYDYGQNHFYDDVLYVSIRIITRWICPAIVFLAIPANVVIIHIFTKLKVNTIPKINYIAIALLDLLEAVTRHFLYFCLVIGHQIGVSSFFGIAQSLTIIPYGCTNTIYFLFAVQRAMVVFFPLKTQGMFTPKSTIISLLVVVFI